LEDFSHVVAMMRARRIPLESLATHRTALADFAEALPRWMEPGAGVIKGLVEL
jgi:threonine dehydrogenase-like Zn-dependent dehydrogenase